MMGVVPQNAGGFGSISDAAAVWASLELEPMQARLQQVNELIGEEVVRFNGFLFRLHDAALHEGGSNG